MESILYAGKELVRAHLFEAFDVTLFSFGADKS